jgi:hypothetical protein
MSPLFGNSEKKQAEKDAAQAAIARLVALPPAELAVELMPALGPEGPRGQGPNHGPNILQIMIFLLKDIPRGASHMTELTEPVREGLQVLEHAELVLRPTRGTGTWFNATRQGEAASLTGLCSSRSNNTSSADQTVPVPRGRPEQHPTRVVAGPQVEVDVRLALAEPANKHDSEHRLPAGPAPG